MKKFEEIFEELKEDSKIKEIWQNAKKEKEKANKIILTICLIIDITILILILIVSKQIMIFTFMPILIVAFVVNIMIYIFVNLFFSKNRKIYQKAFKENIVKKLIENFYTDLQYLPENKMPENTYLEAKYNEHYDNYYSDDYIKAKIDNKYDIEIAEVETQEVTTQTTTDSEGHTTTTTTTTTIFHGLFEKLILDKSINAEVRIGLNRSCLFNKKRIEMDSEEFEKYFDVSTTDKIKAMQLLTADVMEELVEFKNKTNIWYDIIIRNNNIYLKFYCGPMFEPGSLKKGIIDEETVRKYFYMLNFTYNISNKLIKLIEETEM